MLLRNRLHYALSYAEALAIVKDKAGLIRIDGKVRSDLKYPIGFMDIISIERNDEYFRVLFDAKGRFTLVRIDEDDAKTKICKVSTRALGTNGVPYVVTHDGRTIRYPHPDIKPNDSIRINLATNEIEDTVKFEQGSLVMVTGGKNTGRVGVIFHDEKHEGGFDIVHIRDVHGHTFATRLSYAFVIGHGKQAVIDLPRGDGIKSTVLEERAARISRRRS